MEEISKGIDKCIRLCSASKVHASDSFGLKEPQRSIVGFEKIKKELVKIRELVDKKR